MVIPRKAASLSSAAGLVSCSSQECLDERAVRFECRTFIRQGFRRRVIGPQRGFDQGPVDDVALGVAAAKLVGDETHWLQ